VSNVKVLHRGKNLLNLVQKFFTFLQYSNFMLIAFIVLSRR